MILCLLFSAAAMAQYTVSGTVKNAGGEPLIGVNIQEKGTYNGTSTGPGGRYSLTVGSDAIAGLINIVLKSSVEEFTGNFSTGVNKADPGSDFDVLAPRDYDTASWPPG